MFNFPAGLRSHSAAVHRVAELLVDIPQLKTDSSGRRKRFGLDLIPPQISCILSGVQPKEDSLPALIL